MKVVPPFCFLNSNDQSALLGTGEGPAFVLHSLEDLSSLDAFLDLHRGTYIFGFLSYALQAHVTGVPLYHRLPIERKAEA